MFPLGFLGNNDDAIFLAALLSTFTFFFTFISRLMFERGEEGGVGGWTDAL